QLEGALADLAELLLGRASVRRQDRPRRLALGVETRDAHLEELVEVPGRDGEELDALEQRLALALGEREYAPVEVQPGELAVQVALVGARISNDVLGEGRGRHVRAS